MDKSVTLSVKGLILGLLAILALTVAYLLGDAGGTAQAEAAEEVSPVDERRSLTMTGTGKAGVVPDQVAFDVSVKVTRDDLTSALDAANDELSGVLKALEEYGVTKGNVETTGLDMNPVYTYPDDAPPVLTGYRVSESVAVLVKELDQAGGAISAVVATGGNEVRVGDIRLRIGDPEAALADARAEAVELATEKAEEYAAATGQELGPVIRLAEVDPEEAASRVQDQFLPYAADAVRSSANLAALPIRTGRSELSVEVEVIWELAE
ncbi:MAG TPA: SIMPL domain-containing protein [Nocardioides sp.]|nr:SIMPL domain-containing protein [Nocardioides sp.]